VQDVISLIKLDIIHKKEIIVSKLITGSKLFQERGKNPLTLILPGSFVSYDFSKKTSDNMRFSTNDC